MVKKKYIGRTIREFLDGSEITQLDKAVSVCFDLLPMRISIYDIEVNDEWLDNLYEEDDFDENAIIEDAYFDFDDEDSIVVIRLYTE